MIPQQQLLTTKHLEEKKQLTLEQQQERANIEQQIAQLQGQLEGLESKTDTSSTTTFELSPEAEEKFDNLWRQLQELEETLEETISKQEIALATLEVKQSEAAIIVLEQERDQKRKIAAEIEQKRAPYQIFLQNFPIHFYGDNLLQFLTAITLGTTRKPLIEGGQVLLKSGLTALVQKYIKAKTAMFSQLTVAPNENTLINTFLATHTLAEITKNLCQEYKLELSSSQSEEDLATTLQAIFGAIATAYPKHSQHFATVVIQKLWRPLFVKHGLRSQKAAVVSLQPKTACTAFSQIYKM